MTNSTANSKIVAVNNTARKVKYFIDETGKVGQAFCDGAQAFTASANAITEVSEQMNVQEEEFLSRHRSTARDLRRRVLEDAINKKEISSAEALKALKECQTDDAQEISKLLNAHSESNRSQGSKVLKIGAGIGIGAFGLSKLLQALNEIFGNKKQPDLSNS